MGFEMIVMYSFLYLIDTCCIYFIIVYLVRLYRWTTVQGRVEEVSAEAVGDSILYTPTIVYIYQERIFSSPLKGWNASKMYFTDQPIDILVNPTDPNFFAIRDWQTVYVPGLIVVATNIQTIKALSKIWM